MRAFIALDFPENVSNFLKSIQHNINQDGISLAKEIHLTLKFLGDITEPKPIIQELLKIKFDSFSFNLSDIGFFPDRKNPRVVWVGIEPKQECIELQRQIEKTLSNFNFNLNLTFEANATKSGLFFLEFVLFF